MKLKKIEKWEMVEGVNYIAVWSFNNRTWSATVRLKGDEVYSYSYDKHDFILRPFNPDIKIDFYRGKK